MSAVPKNSGLLFTSWTASTPNCKCPEGIPLEFVHRSLVEPHPRHTHTPHHRHLRLRIRVCKTTQWSRDQSKMNRLLAAASGVSETRPRQSLAPSCFVSPAPSSPLPAQLPASDLRCYTDFVNTPRLWGQTLALFGCPGNGVHAPCPVGGWRL